MLEEAAPAIKPVPVCDRVERKEKRLVVHALGAEHEGAMAIEQVEQRNRVRVQQETRCIERNADAWRPMHDEVALLGMPSAREEASARVGPLRQAIDPRDRVGPVAALVGAL